MLDSPLFRPVVLIVDDVSDTRALLADFVRRRGYDALEAGDGAEALAVLRLHEGHVCAIVLDLQMQGMNGFEFRSIQLADPAIARVPVIIVTGVGREAILSYTLRVSHIIFKPVVTEQLEAALQEHCVGAGWSIPIPLFT